MTPYEQGFKDGMEKAASRGDQAARMLAAAMGRATIPDAAHAMSERGARDIMHHVGTNGRTGAAIENGLYTNSIEQGMLNDVLKRPKAAANDVAAIRALLKQRGVSPRDVIRNSFKDGDMAQYIARGNYPAGATPNDMAKLMKEQFLS
jgi:ABC-type transport system substrate-binding protein